MKTFDIFIGTQGYVRVMNEGFFEKVNGRDFDESKQTTFIIGDNAYRVHTQEYRSKKAVFDKFFSSRAKKVINDRFGLNHCYIDTDMKKANTIERNIIINDGTDIDELMKAIDLFECHCKCTVLKFYIHCDHTFTMVEYDGNCVTSWYGQLDDFFTRKVEHFEITGIM